MKDISLKTFLNRCRCCLESFMEDESVSPITDFFTIQFFSFTRLELESDDLLSNHVCEFCHSELLRFSVFKKDLIEKQLKLYSLLKQHNQSLNETDEDFEVIASEEDNNNIDENEFFDEIDHMGSVSENYTESEDSEEEDDVKSDHSSDNDFKVRGIKLPQPFTVPIVIEEPKLLICDYCHSTFAKKQGLIKHVQSHAENINGDWQCDNCNFSTTTRHRLIAHKKQFHDDHNVTKNNYVGPGNVTDSINPVKAKKRTKNLNEILEPVPAKKADIKMPNPIKEQPKEDPEELVIKPKKEKESPKEPGQLKEKPLKIKSRRPVKIPGVIRFRCFCGAPFECKKSVHSHRNRKHGSIKKCNYGCGTTFETIGEWIRHIRDLHPSFEPECLKMVNASKTNTWYTEIKVNDSQVEDLTCQKCSYVASEKTDLVTHYQQKHNNSDGKVECTECFKLFVSNSTLRMHIQTVHNEIRGYICTFCSQTFKQVSHLKDHVKTKHKTVYKPYSCSDCKENFELLTELKKHKQDTHGLEQNKIVEKKEVEMKKKSYICSCKKRFIYPSRLAWHQSYCKTHANRNLVAKEPPKTGTHVCKVCTRSFVLKGNLLRHQRTLGHKSK